MSLDGIKIFGEHAVNGASEEPMSGMSALYAQLARRPGTLQHVFTWKYSEMRQADW